jgi:hypothetical protein
MRETRERQTEKQRDRERERRAREIARAGKMEKQIERWMRGGKWRKRKMEGGRERGTGREVDCGTQSKSNNTGTPLFT